MAEKKEIEVIEPQYGFWEVTVEIATEDSETGKVKKVKEIHLIDAVNVTDCESKLCKEMEGTMWEWRIKSCRQSSINYIY